MASPRLLDLFACAGGAAVGYTRAGFDVWGVDIDHRKAYPYPLLIADALTVLRDDQFLRMFDAIHASPPCQENSRTRCLRDAQGGTVKEDGINLLTPVRELLDSIGKPYITEERADVLTNSQPGTAASTTPAEPAPRRWTWAHDTVGIDEIVVERLTAGHHIKGSRLERLEAVRRLHRRGTCPREIARRLGVHPRQVDRDLIDLEIRIPGAYAQRRNYAARRRHIVRELVRAGARRTEIEVLLHTPEATIKSDFAALRIAGTGRNRAPIRSRAQLLALFGHLLNDLEETG